MKRKLQVFVSSTFTDMLPERQAAVEAILRAGHIPAGMELFAAGDESQWETIQRWIDDSDVYVLILGGRYGSIDPVSSKSYIQLEYEYAIEKNKPFFAVVIKEDHLVAKVKANGPEAIETIHGHLLRAFRETVTKRICRFFGDLNELKLGIYESLDKLDREENLSGWIHGSDVIDPKAILEQVDRLQAENASLRAQLADIEAIAETYLSKKPLADNLSDDTKSLLVAAAASDGMIMHLRYAGGTSVQAGGRNFVHPMSPREEARWKSALDELRQNRLVDSVGGKGEVFRVTKHGYDIADQIAGQAKEVSQPASPVMEE